jgi:HEPN domain-containing protein
MKNITKEWLDKAEQDFLVAEREHNATPPVYDAVCFHCQQCMEKYFKAILQENDVYFEKIHDLDVLLEKCKGFIPELNEFKKGIVELSSYAVEIRYPGVSATNEEADESVLLTKKTRTIIRNYFNISEKETE